LTEVVGLVRVKSVWIYGEEEEKRIFDDLADVVESELKHLDSMIEDSYGVKCIESEVLDYRNYYKFSIKEKLGVYDIVKEFYEPKRYVTVIVIPVEVVVREVEEDGYIWFELAKAQYFLTDTGCYKYHRIDYDDMVDASKAIVTNSLVEAGEVESVE
jgi:hypothetical protein